MATRRKADAKIINQGVDGLVKMDNYISAELMKKVKGEVVKRNGMKKYASGISAGPGTYYNPLYTPTSLQLPRDRKQINVWSFAPDTMIQMVDGSEKRIQDIEVGEFVRSGNGNIRPVTHKYVNHVQKDMVTISTSQNSLSVTADHICYVLDDQDVENVELWNLASIVKEKYASEIKPGDWAFRAIPVGHSNLDHLELGYLLGAYLAEGYIYSGSHTWFDKPRNKERTATYKNAYVELKYGLSEEHIVRKVEEYCHNFGYKVTVTSNHNVYRVWILSNDFAKKCEEACGKGSKEKRLSDDILYASVDVLQAFLSGYIDGDGHQTKTGEIHVATASKTLASQLTSTVFPRLGIIGGHTEYMAGKKLNGGTGYLTQHLRIPRRYGNLLTHCIKTIESGGVATLANKKRVVIKNGLVLEQIKKIESTPYDGNVYDITVDGDFNVNANFLCVRQCRHFYETEAIPAAVIDLYSSLPITGYTIECPNPYYRKYAEDMLKRLKSRELLQGIALEYWKIGDCFIMGELDEEKSDWKRFVILNPDQIEVKTNMLISEPSYQMIPDDNLKKLIFDQEPRQQYNELKMYAPDVIMAVRAGKNIDVDSAHITHLRHTPTPYGTYGVPLMKRVFKTLMYKEMIRRAQFTIAERYVMPLKIFKLGSMDELPEQHEIDAMQEQLTQLMSDPTLVMVTHARFAADWQGIAGKTLQLNGEYDFIEREIISGLGVSRAFLDGLGPTYANASIGGNAFLQKLENFRTSLKEFIENKIFKPIAELNNWYDKDPDTDEEFLVVPEFKWDALRLQDELSRQQTLLQLRGMSLVSGKTMLESLHINAENEAQNMMEERDTIFDANRIMARQMMIQTAVNAQAQKQMMEMQLSMMPPAPGGADPAGGASPSGVPVGGAPEGDDLQGLPGGDKGGNNPIGGGQGFSPMSKATSKPPIAASQMERTIADLKRQIQAVINEPE